MINVLLVTPVSEVSLLLSPPLNTVLTAAPKHGDPTLYCIHILVSYIIQWHCISKQTYVPKSFRTRPTVYFLPTLP